MTKTILILGGSYAGSSTAHYTLKHVLPSLPSPESYEVILVSSSPDLLNRPGTPRALISENFFDQKKFFVDLQEQFKQYGPKFRFVLGRAIALDHENRRVTVQKIDAASEDEPETVIPYTALIIATGSSTPSPLLSLNNGSGADLKSHWATFRTALPKAKTIVVAGGGPAGIETAGELGEYLNGRAGWFSAKLANPKVKITVVTSASQILPIFRPAIADVAEGFLAKVGVEVVKGVSVEGVTPVGAGKGELTATTEVKLSNGQVLPADIYIPAYGMIPNSEFISDELKGDDGRVETNKQTLRVEKAGPRVFALGDVSDFARPAIPIINDAIPVLAANLKRDLLLEAGKEVSGEDRLYTADEGETHMVPIGQSQGVGAIKGYKVPSWFVWLLKGRDYWLWTIGPLWSGKQWAKQT
ncbi:hypothetical protein BJX70DRAFT_45799 [Aspergillus crustosus]